MDEYVEHYDRSARTLLDLITELSDSIKGELWRELEEA